MKEFKGKAALAILCGILGLVISMQFKTVRNTPGGGTISTQKAHQLAIELNNLRNEKELLNEELTNLERRLKEYELSESDENLIIKNLKNDLERYQLYTGLKPAVGPGVTITVEDPATESPSTEGSFIMYNYDIILSLINKLNASGAEAISINDQRYIATTEVYYTSNNILINQVPTNPPFVIKAIGNPDTLEAALNMRFDVVWEMRQYGLQVNIKKENMIEVPRYNKVIEYKYAKPIETVQ
ncbi:DUF881 domain-containing protein [Serpentinicella alkaliphila]|uniref:Uncharacterized protein YlxW (UPF0749 family) n=1 Tax=Serpentinicella alkaliphila TaxID=1734049 RepID=A0A4R2TY30_9FIRM|nr:DUF881 domain-containing protein [Serpentinicella alkaliphila]QUH26767.1 DUF881 domain-containing protein [Serpentinicella alkaliphila]TCQ07987.1 uncharacterized protein YlxW (UPF0749 family) [Serpentinicella alkaliphila]